MIGLTVTVAVATQMGWHNRATGVILAAMLFSTWLAHAAIHAAIDNEPAWGRMEPVDYFVNENNIMKMWPKNPLA